MKLKKENIKMKKEKVVIVTLYDSINCGTFLQAFSLGEYIRSIGFEPVYLRLKNDNTRVNGKNVTIKKSSINKLFIKVIRKIMLKIKFSTMMKYFELIDLNEVNSDDTIKYVIIGSDEIWNVNNNSFTHYDEFFGYNFKNKKIIAYAPSCNDITKDDVIRYDSNLNFNMFDCLSARDKNTFELLSDFGFENITMVLDPTFLSNSYMKQLVDVKLKNYIIVYGHNFNEEQISIIKKIATKQSKKLVSITKYYEWCDKNIIASPFEFLSYIKNADYIITSTFHGSVFSIVFEKNFICFVENKNKVSDLLGKFDLQDRIFNDFDSGLNLLNKNIDYTKVNELKKIYLKESVKYLYNSLDVEKKNE